MGKHNVVYTCTIATPLGALTASAIEESLTGLWFNKQKYYPLRADDWLKEPDYPVLTKLQAWIDEYFAGINSAPGFQLNPQGTAFQKTVWNALVKIPYGQVTTYGKIAQNIALARNLPKMSAQAVGGAVGRNPISILIPCHRVVGSNGSLIGYASGVDKKEYLLRLEKNSL
jgi:methylated-DNA-[protein]-cysteine S-methyltransferase